MWNNSVRQIARHMVRRCYNEANSAPPIRREKCVNSVTLVGRVGNHPEIKTKANQDTFVTFPVATNSYYKIGEGDFQQRTEWHKICVYRPMLRDLVSDIVKKGDRIYVQGKIASVSYTPEDGGRDIKLVRINADDVIRLSSVPHQGSDENNLNINL